jgi:peptidoglycan/xylan/chitin deacetylase (PgdA/CDA1 family)
VPATRVQHLSGAEYRALYENVLDDDLTQSGGALHAAERHAVEEGRVVSCSSGYAASMRMALIATAVLAGCSFDGGSSEGRSSDGGSSDGAGAETDGVTVSLTFDDTFADQQAAIELLDERGMRGTFYVDSGRIDSTQALSASQLLEMQANGHEIAGHTIDHVNLPMSDPAEQRRQVCDDRVALIEMGFEVTSFAYPFGASDEMTQALVAECGYNSARDIGGRSSPIPPPDPYLVRTAPSVKAETTADDLEGYVAEAEPDGAWVPIVFHHVCDGCSTNGIAPAVLADFLDRLEARGTQVLTVDEVIGGDMKPPVPASP